MRQDDEKEGHRGGWPTKSLACDAEIGSWSVRPTMILRRVVGQGGEVDATQEISITCDSSIPIPYLPRLVPPRTKIPQSQLCKEQMRLWQE